MAESVSWRGHIGNTYRHRWYNSGFTMSCLGCEVWNNHNCGTRLWGSDYEFYWKGTGKLMSMGISLNTESISWKEEEGHMFIRGFFLKVKPVSQQQDKGSRWCSFTIKSRTQKQNAHTRHTHAQNNNTVKWELNLLRKTLPYY